MNDFSSRGPRSLFNKKMNKLNQILHISQQKSQETIKFFIKSLFPKEHKLLQLLVWFRKNNLWNECSQEYLAIKCGYSRRQISRILIRFRDAGLIYWLYRHRHTCIYYFTDIFDDPEMKKFLGNYIQGVYYLPKQMLLSIRKVFQSAYKWVKKRPSGKRPPAGDVTPLYIISYSSSSNISFYNRTKCIDIDRFTDSKKELLVETDRSAMIRSLESLKNTPMSIADIKAIEAYPDEVIQYADRQAKRKGTLVNPIGYFLVCCREFNKKRLAKGDNPTLRLETRHNPRSTRTGESLQRGMTEISSLVESYADVLAKTKARAEATAKSLEKVNRASQERCAAQADQCRNDNNHFTQMLRAMLGV